MSAFGGKAAIERTCVDATVLLPLAAALSPLPKSIIAWVCFLGYGLLKLIGLVSLEKVHRKSERIRETHQLLLI